MLAVKVLHKFDVNNRQSKHLLHAHLLDCELLVRFWDLSFLSWLIMMVGHGALWT